MEHAAGARPPAARFCRITRFAQFHALGETANRAGNRKSHATVIWEARDRREVSARPSSRIGSREGWGATLRERGGMTSKLVGVRQICNSQRKDKGMAKNTIFLWYDKDAEAAARFYAETFPNSAVRAVHRAPSDYPAGKAGDVLTVEFTVAGVSCIGLNGGPTFKHNESFSFQIATDDQRETDRYWNAIVRNGGQESQCGWCKDKWGVSWQITPRVLTEALAAGGDEAKRAFVAMMGMKKIDVSAIEAARRG
jgi:predicted 3-demethylubiquinone-9 3-methyltransferase (glyoxalase superfamily)